MAYVLVNPMPSGRPLQSLLRSLRFMLFRGLPFDMHFLLLPCSCNFLDLFQFLTLIKYPHYVFIPSFSAFSSNLKCKTTRVDEVNDTWHTQPVGYLMTQQTLMGYLSLTRQSGFLAEWTILSLTSRGKI